MAELEKLSNNDVFVFEQLIRDLVELQKETRLSVMVMIQKAIKQYIDNEKSDEKHVWIEGIKYPIPERIP